MNACDKYVASLVTTLVTGGGILVRMTSMTDVRYKTRLRAG